MKLCLCMSGHARSILQTHEGWNNHLLSKFDVDVFMHLWDTVGPRNKEISNTDNQSGVLDDSPKIDVNEIIRIWNPLHIVVEPYQPRHTTFEERVKPWYIKRNELNERLIDRPLSNFAMYYKWWACNQLKCSEEKLWSKKYDLVIRTRPDMNLTGPIPLDVINSDFAYIPKSGGWHSDEISDFMTIGTSAQIDLYCEIYNQLDQKFNDAVAEGDFSKALYPHRLFYWHFKNNGIPFKEIDIPCLIL